MMTETKKCGLIKTTFHARGVSKSRKIIAFSHLNSINLNDNFKDNFMQKKVKSIFASFEFMHHLYVWERSQVAF